MSETYGQREENERELTLRDELLDGPQPGFRHYTDEELEELKAQDEDYLDQVAEGLDDKRLRAARNIGKNIVLGYN